MSRVVRTGHFNLSSYDDSLDHPYPVVLMKDSSIRPFSWSLFDDILIVFFCHRCRSQFISDCL